MTTITSTCEGCGRQLAVPERYQGRELKCPECGHPFLAVPKPSAPPPPAEAAHPEPAPAPPPADRPPAGRAAEPFAELFTATPEEPAPAREGAEAPAEVAVGPVYWRLRRVGVLSAAIVSGVAYAVLGLALGLVVAVASTFLPAPAIPIVSTKLVGALAVVVFPLLYGAIGFLAGLLGALLYNLAARLAGGVRLLLE
jgi:DNA-directed RNA polymerase subunit RPC12/RpoP